MGFNIHEKAAVGFDRVGDSYERGRPEYPQEAIEFLVKNLQIHKSSLVVDLGAGTGKFTKFLIPYSNQVLAVEPVDGMRNKFTSLYPDIKMLSGSAEKMPINAQSIDAVFVAQAFNWV